MIREERLTLTTDASGNATGYIGPVSGKISHIRYVKHGVTPFADTVDFDVTLNRSGVVVLDEDNVTASMTRAPRQASHGTNGVAALYAGSGLGVLDHIVVPDDRVKFVVANGGDTKTGDFYVAFE